VHVREVGLLVADVDGGRTRILPGLLEQPEFMFDVGHLGGVAHARRLDAQDGDLVEQLAGRNRHLDVFHVSRSSGLKANSSSSFAVTDATSMSSMTPGFSIFVV